MKRANIFSERKKVEIERTQHYGCKHWGLKIVFKDSVQISTEHVRALVDGGNLIGDGGDLLGDGGDLLGDGEKIFSGTF